MSKYIKAIPLSQVGRLSIYVNEGRKTLVQIKRETGADYLLNGGLFDMGRWRAVCHLKADGYTWAEDPYTYFGYRWNGTDLTMGTVPGVADNYIACVALLRGGKPCDLIYNADLGGSRPRSAMGMMGEKLCLYCTDGGVTPERLRAELLALGWDSAVMLDGGGSAQCDFQGDKIISGRKVHNLILVHLKKEGGTEPPKEEPMKTVCLDPGHGVESPGKQSPDGTYFEHEFNLDMAFRIKAHLERHGVKVVLTREDEHCPTGKADDNDLNKRVSISDGAGADLFVSLHSNAQGGSGWGTVRGYGIYTSAGPETAERNVAARKLLARAKEAEIPLWGGGLFHKLDLVVTRKTKAPAVLIEHGFHTHREETERLKRDDYRAVLSEVDAKGVLDFLGVAWVPVKPVEPVAACPHCGGALRIEKGDT